MKVPLNVGERLIVCTIIPKEGSFVTLKLIRGIIQKLGMSAQDMKEFEIVEEDGQTRWNAKGAAPKEFEFEDVELSVIRKELKELDSKNRLNTEMLSVYEKFCT